LQLKQGGGAGGHNGLSSIHEQLGGADCGRLRFGIDKPTGPNAKERVVGHVLGNFSHAEQPELKRLLTDSAERCEAWARDGMQKAMNRLNTQSKPKP
jgi:peptidyl-tRNA hydrolase, PTH1 family